MIKAYENSKLKRFLYYFCSFMIDKEEYQRKLFHGKYLKVEKAIEPSLIMWENLGTTPVVRFLRLLGTSLVAVLLLSVTVVGVLSLQQYVENKF